jgi:hypothetical protein
MFSFAEEKLWYVYRICSVCVFISQFQVYVQYYDYLQLKQ